ncbi:TPA: hypothetical protein ACH3X2_002846 [Trebouxia sp. C0005]
MPGSQRRREYSVHSKVVSGCACDQVCIRNASSLIFAAMQDKFVHMQANRLNKNEHAGLILPCILINLITTDTMTQLFVLQSTTLQLMITSWSHLQLPKC